MIQRITNNHDLQEMASMCVLLDKTSSRFITKNSFFIIEKMNLPNLIPVYQEYNGGL